MIHEFVMTQTERMKNPINSFDVFEFKAEDELTEMKFPSKFAYSHDLDVSRTGIKSKEIDIGICGGADVGIDYNGAAAGSVAPVENEDFSKEMPKLLSDVLPNTHNDFKSHEQAAENKSKLIESSSPFASVECISSLGAVRLQDNSNVAVQDSLCNVRAVHMDSDADENLSERSPSATANINASSDGPSSDKCSSDWNMRDEMVGIVFYPDYIDYCGTHYLDSVVSFSRSFVEASSKTVYGNERTFQVRLEVEDIVKIESQWSARYEAGTVNIYFISKDGVQDGIIHNASGLQELKFPTVDSDWYQKQEAIASLDVRYKALWNVLLDSGIENISPLPEGETMMQTRSYFPKFDKPFEEVIYPKGDPDAVSISKRDVDLLLPDTFVNDTIIDFYIKYLKSKQNAEERTKFHFFNSFFFRKLADMDKDPSSAFDGKAAFQRVRKWTRKINLLEKDFIFVPVNYNYHWSLIVICYFGEVSSYKDVEDGKSVRVPCILHMDSLRGTHVGLKDLLQSYLWEEWKQRRNGTSEDLCWNFRNLKFIPLELPQQQNLYDCGLFLLHYVELFLEEVPANFSIYKITSSSNFLQEDWFPPEEASMKRTHIERLISDLLDTQYEDCPPFGGSGMHCSPENLNMTHGYDNGVEFSVESSPLGGCLESSLRQIYQGIDLTLLPSSSTRGAECERANSGLVLKELFKQASGSLSFNDAPWGASGSGLSLREFKTHVPLTEKEVGEANECFVQVEEPVFHHVYGVTADEPDSPYSSGDFRLNQIHQPLPDDVGSSPVTSGSFSDDDIVEVEGADDNIVTLNDELDKFNRLTSEKIEHLTNSSDFSSDMLNAKNSRSLDKITDPNDDKSFFLKDLCRETNQLHNQDPSHEGLAVCAVFASDVKVDVRESVIPPRCDGHELVLESDEQHSAKRMRISLPDDEKEVTDNLSEDLHL